MGKMVEHPKYNIVSLRVSDDLVKKLDAKVKSLKTTRTVFMTRLLEESLG